MSWPARFLRTPAATRCSAFPICAKITDEGVRFRSHLDGSEHLLTPEKAAEIQLALGSDIAMVLDECIETPAPRDDAEAALKRTTEWARRARKYFLEQAQQQRRTGAMAIRHRAGRDVCRICAAKARGNFWNWIFPDTPSAGWPSASRTKSPAK